MDKRTRILMAALKVFSRRGFHQVKVEEIAQEAEIGKGTIYEYFESKEDIFHQIYRLSSERYTSVFQEMQTQGTDLWDKIKILSLKHIEFFQTHKDMSAFVLDGQSRPLESLNEWLMEQKEQRQELVREMLAQAVENGEIRKVDPDLASRMVMGLIFSVFGGMIFMEGTVPEEKTVEGMLDILKKGLIYKN
ncbi:MAG: TetR/AcrR family transcriptional regulator [Candidatus Contubernalis sp.]|nr:TetR/AcrR family transcriptional regulator [Candidatus Contubernalis sp.]